MRHGSQPMANRPPHLVASYDTQGVLRTYSNPDAPRGSISSELKALNALISVLFGVSFLSLDVLVN